MTNWSRSCTVCWAWICRLGRFALLASGWVKTDPYKNPEDQRDLIESSVKNRERAAGEGEVGGIE